MHIDESHHSITNALGAAEPAHDSRAPTCRVDQAFTGHRKALVPRRDLQSEAPAGRSHRGVLVLDCRPHREFVRTPCRDDAIARDCLYRLEHVLHAQLAEQIAAVSVHHLADSIAVVTRCLDEQGARTMPRELARCDGAGRATADDDRAEREPQGVLSGDWLAGPT